MKMILRALLIALILPAVGAFADAGTIVRRDTELVTESGEPFTIRSISLGTADVSGALQLPLDDIYNDIQYLGFNTVTLHIDSAMLTTDTPGVYDPDGLASLDAHIASAAQRGIHVILNMDSPPGGFQSWGQGSELWTDVSNQQQLIALWAAIARRYATNDTVLGYGLLNEPCPVAETGATALRAWQTLAEQLTAAIRAYDTRHLLFVEAVYRYQQTPYGSMLDPRSDSSSVYPVLDDSGVVLQTQQFDPYQFTSQAWSDPEDTPYLVYPSQFLSGLEHEDETILTTDNENFDIHTEYWDTVSSQKYTVTDESIQYVQPCISLWQMGESGAVWIDEMYLSEFDENGEFLRTALYLSFNSQTDFSLYASTGQALYVSTGGLDGVGGTLYIQGVLEGGYAVLEAARLPVQIGHSYQLTCTLGGTDLPDSSSISPMLCFHTGSGPIPFGPELLRRELLADLDASRALGAPLYIGGFGTNLASFSHGGVNWVSDMLSLYEQYGVHSNYFIYRNDYYGLYTLDGAVNQPLYDLFAARTGS